METEGIEPNRTGAVFLVERYLRETNAHAHLDVLPRMERAARDMSAAGRLVEHVGSIVVPGDGVVFSVIRAEAESDVREMAERADAPADRVAEATVHGFGLASDEIGERGEAPREGGTA